MAKNTNAELFAPVAAPVKAPRRRAAKKTAVAAAVAAAVTVAAAAPAQAQAPAIITAAPAQAQAPAIITAAPAQVQAPAISPAAPAQVQAPAISPAAPAQVQAPAISPAPVAAAGLTWAKTAPRAKDQNTNLFSFRHGFEFTAIDGKIRFIKPQLAFSMDDLKALFGLNYAKYIKANLASYAARFYSDNVPTRNYIWLYSDILRFAGSTKNRKAIKQAVRNYYNQING